MSYLIDTNIISELIKARPNPNVIQWVQSVNNKDLHLSVLTIGEIRKGIGKVEDIKRKERLRMWLEQELTSWFIGRILPIDQHVANKWGVLQSRYERTLPAIDSLIAATALHFDLILVTRNVKDFNYYTTLDIINPFII